MSETPLERPAWVEDLLDPELTDAEYRLLVWFKRVQGKNGSSWYTQDEMAMAMGRSESAIKRTAKGLVEKGRLRVDRPERQGRKMRNHYTVVERQEGAQECTPSDHEKGSESEPLTQDKGATNEPLMEEKGFKSEPKRGSEMTSPEYYTGIIKEKKHIYPPESPAYRLSDLLRSKIRERKADFAGGKDLQAWAKHVDQMIRLDHRTPERIEAVICYAQADNVPRGQRKFCWANVILSTESLRNGFDKIELQMQTTPAEEMGYLNEWVPGCSPEERAEQTSTEHAAIMMLLAKVVPKGPGLSASREDKLAYRAVIREQVDELLRNMRHDDPKTRQPSTTGAGDTGDGNRGRNGLVIENRRPLREVRESAAVG